jgi:homocysteine S-methyltransferase
VRLDSGAAQDYHSDQVGAFADSVADLVTAVTMTYADEALGVARAARAAGIPAVISFTVETDGRLPSGQDLADAIAEVDGEADTDVAYFMVNCAHPTHFAHVIDSGGPWLERVRGVRANASTMSHAELDEATDLDDGDPADFGSRHRQLRDRMPALNVFGGCCGTDVRHVVAVRDAIAG